MTVIDQKVRKNKTIWLISIPCLHLKKIYVTGIASCQGNTTLVFFLNYLNSDLINKDLW